MKWRRTSQPLNKAPFFCWGWGLPPKHLCFIYSPPQDLTQSWGLQCAVGRVVKKTGMIRWLRSAWQGGPGSSLSKGLLIMPGGSHLPLCEWGLVSVPAVEQGLGKWEGPFWLAGGSSAPAQGPESADLPVANYSHTNFKTSLSPPSFLPSFFSTHSPCKAVLSRDCIQLEGRLLNLELSTTLAWSVQCPQPRGEGRSRLKISIFPRGFTLRMV